MRGGGPGLVRFQMLDETWQCLCSGDNDLERIDCYSQQYLCASKLTKSTPHYLLLHHPPIFLPRQPSVLTSSLPTDEEEVPNMESVCWCWW